MKILLFTFILLSSISIFSQNIQVSTNKYTVPELVNEVLINSKCAVVSNINWITGTNYNSVNGIGYFENTNPNFSIQKGVILSTGDVLRSNGPNLDVLSDGVDEWKGDKDLEKTLADSGIIMNSLNATVLEFDFLPLSSYFGFKFLFASEEYGNYQCQFSDSFAFLLTDLVTGETKNLAVLPNSTIPISVVTIRDELYNSSCSSVNKEYFSHYNGGNNASVSATNYNGETVLMSVSSVLKPNTPYRIKLVVADRKDVKRDSAIFLSGGSFNIGQNVLGQDLVICEGASTVLDSGLNPSDFTFVWSYNDTVIDNETSSKLTANKPGKYQLTYTNKANPCQTFTNSINVSNYPKLSEGNPIDLYKCKTGQNIYTYDLSIDNSYIVGQNKNLTVTYHSTLNDANLGKNILPILYKSSGNKTIYVRVFNKNTGCYTIKNFDLLLADTPRANESEKEFLQCTDGNVATFMLSDFNTKILGGQDNKIYDVKYYETKINAIDNKNELPLKYVSGNKTIYARVFLKQDFTCGSNIAEVKLILQTKPKIEEFKDVFECSNYILPPLENGAKYFTEPNGTGNQLPEGTIITKTTKPIYVYIKDQNSLFPCAAETKFNVFIFEDSNLNEINSLSDIYCDSYILPEIKFGEYRTKPNGEGNTIPAGTEIKQTQTIYFYYSSDTNSKCVKDVKSDIIIKNDFKVPEILNVFDCESYKLKPLSLGKYYTKPNGEGIEMQAGETIKKSQRIYIY